MQAQSRAIMFGLSTALAVGAIGFLAWRAMEQSPRLFAPPAPAPASAPVVTAAAPPRDVAPAHVAPVAKSIPASFDIVSVEPDGSTVVAGRAGPGAQVQLLNNGVVIASVKADMNGQFALVPPPLAQGNHLLSLATDGKPSETAQTVAVAVPSRGQGEAFVVLTQPGVATRILSERLAPAIKNDVPTPALAIRSVEADEAGGFYASGTAAPGAGVKLSLNGAPIASVESGSDGRWSLKIQKGMAAGAYAVRAEQMDAAGKIIAQVEVPFDYPERARTPVVAPAPATGEPRSPQPGSASHAIVPEVQSVTVQPGDSLWKISQRMLGSGYRYTQIYAANTGQIRNPSLIYPNQILVVPGGSPAN